MSGRLFYWSLTSALAGFIFGFDTVVVSGVEQRISELWELSPLTHGFALSAALWGTVIGALLGGFPTDYFGRKSTLVWIGILYFASAVWSALANDVYSFAIARFIGGVGVGISTIAAPLYIAEISPPDRRGRLAGMFQFNIVFGILVAYASNAILSKVGENGWRWMLGVEAAPALIYTLMCLGLPKSPRWLIIRRGDHHQAKEVLSLIEPQASEQELQELVDSISQSTNQQTESTDIPWRKIATPLLLAFLIAFFNQLSGINAILYFAPRIFEAAGLDEQSALLQSVGIGVTNLIFTFAGLALIDKLGRRTLLYIGSIGYIGSLGTCAWAFFSGNLGIVPYCIFAFIGAHAIGQGAVIWVFISEIFPNKFRAVGQTVGSATHWIFAALLTYLFPVAAEHIVPGYIFAFFCGMMILQLLWVASMVPETKGVPLEQLERQLGINPSSV